MNIPLSGFPEKIADTLRSGATHHFEICEVRAWELSKAYLSEQHGIECNSPKSAYKELWRVNDIDDPLYRHLVCAVNDRHLLSHVCEEITRAGIFTRMTEHLGAFQELLKIVSGCGSTRTAEVKTGLHFGQDCAICP